MDVWSCTSRPKPYLIFKWMLRNKEQKFQESAVNFYRPAFQWTNGNRVLQLSCGFSDFLSVEQGVLFEHFHVFLSSRALNYRFLHIKMIALLSTFKQTKNRLKIGWDTAKIAGRLHTCLKPVVGLLLSVEVSGQLTVFKCLTQSVQFSAHWAPDKPSIAEGSVAAFRSLVPRWKSQISQANLYHTWLFHLGTRNLYAAVQRPLIAPFTSIGCMLTSRSIIRALIFQHAYSTGACNSCMCQL